MNEMGGNRQNGSGDSGLPGEIGQNRSELVKTRPKLGQIEPNVLRNLGGQFRRNDSQAIPHRTSSPRYE